MVDGALLFIIDPSAIRGASWMLLIFLGHVSVIGGAVLDRLKMIQMAAGELGMMGLRK